MSNAKLIAAAAAGAAAVVAAKLISTYLGSFVSETPKFYYWPARGRGEQIRLTMAAAGMDWEEHTFDMRKEDEKQAFFASCRKIGGNLTTNIPMLCIDGLTLTQSSAVLRYVARKFGLYPEGTAAAYEVDNLIAAAEDLRTANYKAMKMMGAGQKEKDAYIAGLPAHLDNFARMLSAKDWFTGYFTVGDLTIYDALDVAERQLPGTLAKYPTLKAFHARLEARPQVKKWIESEKRGKLFAFPAI